MCTVLCKVHNCTLHMASHKEVENVNSTRYRVSLYYRYMSNSVREKNYVNYVKYKKNVTVTTYLPTTGLEPEPYVFIFTVRHRYLKCT
jgi:hypothetical protein